MHASDLVLVRGMHGTRATLRAWQRAPQRILLPWVLGGFGIAVVLLVAVWVVSISVQPDPTPMRFHGVNAPVDPWHGLEILRRNSLVLALHAFACVAGYIAGAAMPAEARRYNRFWRAVHDHVGRFAIAWVVGCTLFSLVTQAYILGYGTATLSNQFEISEALLLVCLLPHALPELTALFLPLAAWTIASRNGDWHHLLAATFVTVGIAVPVLVSSTIVELYVSPRLLSAAL